MAKLKEAAIELNKVLGLTDPAIDIKAKEDDLKADLIEAAGLLVPEDEISEDTRMTLIEIGAIDVDESEETESSENQQETPEEPETDPGSSEWLDEKHPPLKEYVHIPPVLKDTKTDNLIKLIVKEISDMANDEPEDGAHPGVTLEYIMKKANEENINMAEKTVKAWLRDTWKTFAAMNELGILRIEFGTNAYTMDE